MTGCGSQRLGTPEHAPVADIRLSVLDDGLFVRTDAGDVRPLSATFNRFVEGVARSGQFRRVRYIVPVRPLQTGEVEPAVDPVDQKVLEIVPTTFFAGIADYLLRAGYVAARNWPVIDRAVAESDLVWLRLPASNALLALAAARRHRVPYFGWVAGSVQQVAAAQQRWPPAAIVARAVGAAYDAVTNLAGRNGPLITLDAELFASVVTDTDITETRAMVQPAPNGPARLVWAGRMAGEKGLAELVAAVSLLLRQGADVALVLIGDGPARPAVQRLLRSVPADRVEYHGHVGDRLRYMQLLRSGHIFVHPSRAEGVPKVLVEAMAAGLPIVATATGGVRDVLGNGERGRLVPPHDVDAIVAAARELLDDEWQRRFLRDRGLEWAGQHTVEAQADRLVNWMRDHFPQLPWPG